MKCTISFEFDTVTNSEDLVAWLNAALSGGEPVGVAKPEKSRKPKKEKTSEEKAVVVRNMARGREKKRIEEEGGKWDEAAEAAFEIKHNAMLEAKAASVEAHKQFFRKDWEEAYQEKLNASAEDKVAKAEALGEELAKGSKSVATKKSGSKRNPAAKKKAKKKAVSEPEAV